MKQALLWIMLGTFTFSAIGQENKELEKHYLLYNKEGKKKKLKDIVAAAADYDVIFFGEEHDDSVGHYLQNRLFTELHKAYGEAATISMEMFDRDVQYIVDEYLAGIIKTSYFEKDSRKWKNYKDYKPMVEYAKENGLKVIAANAPFRYVNVASKNGQEELNKLSDKAKKAIAPLPYAVASGAYEKKLNDMMGGHMPTKKDTVTGEEKPYMRWDGQSLWDATMSWSIAEYFKANPKSKILHLNGRFHSDEGYGIVEHLKKHAPEARILIISSGREESYPKIKAEDFTHLGDWIIITDPEVPSSY